MAHIDINAVNIRAASFRGDLRKVQRNGRDGPYVSIQDKFGTIEVADNMEEAARRIAQVCAD